MILSDKKSYDDAQRALERSTKLKPDFALAWNRLGRVELRRGQIPASIAAQERARKLEPKNGAFAADLCRTLFEAKDPARAVAECRAAVALDPANPLARYELGQGAGGQGRLRRRRRPSWRSSAASPASSPRPRPRPDAIAKSCAPHEKVARFSRLRHGERVANLP